MLPSLFNFIWIAFCAFLFGFAACRVLVHFHLTSNEALAPDMIFIAGIGTLTAFAQWFSIFYRVGMLSLLTLIILNALIVLFCFRPLKKWTCRFLQTRNVYRYLFWLSIAAVFLPFWLLRPLLFTIHPCIMFRPLSGLKNMAW